MLRVVFFGSSQNVFSRRFYEALRQTPAEIAAAVDVPAAKRSSTNPTEAGHAFTEDAARHGVPVYEPVSPNAAEFVAAIRGLRPDLFLAVGYMLRLEAEILAVPRIVSANVHASLLPAYRGRSPVFWALRNGEQYSGLTIHAMDDRLDTGDLLYKVRVRTRKCDTVASLYDRIIAAGQRLVPRLVADAEQRRVARTPQPADGGSYFSAAKEADFQIRWSQAAEQLRRWITITPGKCFAIVRGERVYFLDAKLATRPHGEARAGTLLRLSRRGCTIATGQGAIRVCNIEVVPGGRSPLSEWCRGHGLRAGDCVGGS